MSAASGATVVYPDHSAEDPLVIGGQFDTLYDTGIPSKLGGGHFNYMVRTDVPDEAQGNPLNKLNRPNKSDKGCCFVTVSVNEVSDINPSARSYGARVRLYLVWYPILGSKEARELYTRHLSASRDGSRVITLNEAEYAEAEATLLIPQLVFPDACEVEELDASRLKIYPGGWLLWTRAYRIVHVAEYNLRYFPYDVHPLPIKLSQLSDKVNFKLTVAQAQYAKALLAMPEWTALRPSAGAANNGKGVFVYINVKRNSVYYNKNILVVIFALTCTSFCVYTFGRSSTSDRVNTILVLLLTVVAFKLGINDSLPKLGYDTVLDKYLSLNMGFLFSQVVFSVFYQLFKDIWDGFAELKTEHLLQNNTKSLTWTPIVFDLNLLLFCLSMLIYFVLNVTWFTCAGDRLAKSRLGFKKKLERGFYSTTFCTGLKFLDYTLTDTDANLGDIFFKKK